MTAIGDLNLILSLILDVSVFMSGLSFMLSRDEYEKSCIFSGPDQKPPR